MRVGLLTDCYKPLVNGVTHFVSLHRKVLDAWGHEPYVFTLGNCDYQDRDPRVIRSPAAPLAQTGYHLAMRHSRTAREVAETMDVLHVQHPFMAGRQAISLARKADIPLVFTNHSQYRRVAPYYLPSVLHELSDAALRAYLRSFFAQCDLVVAPSQGVARSLKDMRTTAPIEVIPNGIEVDRWSNPTAPVSGADLGLPADACVAIAVTRLAPEKNLPFLLDALRRAAATSPDLHLVLVGRGPSRERLEQIVHDTGQEDRVHFVGEIAYEEVPNWLALADFFAIASRTEGHPLVVLEALAAGLPVVGVAATGIEDTVRDGSNGLLSPEEVDAFALHMARLATDGELRSRLANGARRSRRRVDIRNTTERLLSHYERLIDARRGNGV
jgi:glycosyltransferase involved in cell wall biosynthesis